MKCLWFRAVFRHTIVTRTFMDPCGPQHVYVPCGHFSSLFSIFFLSYFSPKRLYHPPYHWQLHDRLSPSSQHHIWLHPPIFSCLFHILLLFVITISPQFTCTNWVDTILYLISIWVLCSLSQLLSKVLKPAPLQPSSILAYIASDFLDYLLSPLIAIHICFIFAQD